MDGDLRLYDTEGVSKSVLYAGCFKGSYVAGKPMTADGIAPG